jgi:hypothetical protein
MTYINPEDGAFATSYKDAEYASGGDQVQYGLTKREYFAAAIMQGFIASLTADAHEQHFQPSVAAQIVVLWTDRLIEALNEKR